MSSITGSGAGKYFGSEEISRDVSFRLERGERETIEARESLRALEEAAESLSGRLAAIGSTATPSQLGEIMDRYGEALAALEEGDSTWLAAQRALLASSV
jgi:hypothetical protein